MVVMNGIFGDIELKYLDKEGYIGLQHCLTPYIVECLNNYIHNEEADPEVVEKINKYLGYTIEGLLVPTELLQTTNSNKSLIDMISYVHDKNVINLPRKDQETIIETFDGLNEKIKLSPIMLKPSKRDEYAMFVNGMKRAVAAIHASGQSTTYNDIMTRIKHNEQLFYTNRKHTYKTDAYRLDASKFIWQTALMGCKWAMYCDDNNITNVKRGTLLNA